MSIESVYSEYDDRVPPEAYEPHAYIALDVHIGVVVNVAFDSAPTPEEFDRAVYENAKEALLDDRLREEDVYEWSVLYVETERE